MSVTGSGRYAKHPAQAKGGCVMHLELTTRNLSRGHFLRLLATAGATAFFQGCEGSGGGDDGGGGQVVYLTFDDGPGRDTPDLLEALQGAHATFFMLGIHAEQHPDLARMVKADGHAIGNHSYSHRDFDRLSLDQIAGEIDDGGEAIKTATGRQPKLFRPPYLSGDAQADQVAVDRGYRVVRGFNTHDYDSNNAEQLAGRVLNNLAPGAILMFHDSDPTGTASRQVTVAAIRILIPELRARGYRPAVLS